MERVAHVFVAPSSKQQTLAYVAKFAASRDRNLDQWSAAEFEAALVANRDVAGLASSSLMLFMVLTILPSISGGDCCKQRRRQQRAVGHGLWELAPLVELRAEGAWLLIWRSSVWLRRELQRGK